MLVNLLACAAPEPGSDPDPARALEVSEQTVEPASSSAEELRAERLDVPIVVGAGPAGLAAAMDLGQAVVFEAADEVGGRARWSGGFLFLVGTEEQAAAGIEDSAALAASEWETLTGAAATDSTRAWLAATDGVRDRLVALGLTLSLARTDPLLGHQREHGPDGGGQALVDTLAAGLPEGVEVRTGTPVRGLVLRDGVAAGVLTDAGWVESDTVVIASGGFVDRADLVELNAGWSAGSWRLGEATLADGAALDWAEEAGLGTACLGAIGAYRDVLGIPGADGQAMQAQVGSVLPWLWVDGDGQRFIDESATWSLTLAGLAGAHDNVWALSTQEMLTAAVSAEDAPFLVESDAFVCASTWSELAGRIEVDPLGVEDTLSSLVELLAGGEDPFGRTGFLPLVGTPCAFRPGHIAAKNFGGIAVDADGRVLDAGGAVVPGLWAVGEAAGMGAPGLGGAWGFDGSLSAVIWSGWRTAEAIRGE